MRVGLEQSCSFAELLFDQSTGQLIEYRLFKVAKDLFTATICAYCDCDCDHDHVYLVWFGLMNLL